jgi:hypothetical protein
MLSGQPWRIEPLILKAGNPIVWNLDCKRLYNILKVKGAGIATGYGLDGLRSIPGRGKIFLFSTVSGLA